MKKHQSSSFWKGFASSARILIAALLMVFVGAVHPVSAQTYTFNTGTGSAGWTSGAGWSPSAPVSSGTTTLTFSGTTTATTTSTNDMGVFNLTTLNDTHVGSFALTIAGNQLNFTGTTNAINFSSTIGDAISAPINFTNGLVVNVTPFVSYTISGVISGSGGLTKNGANGGLTLSNANTYTGGTTLNGNTLTFGNASAFSSGAVNFNAGSLATTLTAPTLANAFFIGGNVSFVPGNGSSITLSGPVDLTGDNRTLSVAAGTSLIFSGVVSDGGLVKASTGKLLLSTAGTNTYAGGTTINNGVLQFDKNSDVPASGTVLINNGGALEVNATSGMTSITSWLGSGLISTASQGTIAFKGGTTSENVDFNTPGYTGLFLGASAATTYTGTFTPGAGVYRLGGGGSTLTLSLANTLSGTNSLIAGEALSLASLVNAAGLPAQTSAGGTVAIGAANNMSGTTTVNSGILALSGTGATQGSIANSDITVNTGGTLAIDTGSGTITRANSVTLNAGAVFTDTGITTAVTTDTITNAITANEGLSTITLTGTKTELAAGSLNRSAGAVLLVRGATYGTGSIGGGTSSNIILGTAPTLIGSGAAGTTTVGIIPWAIGSSTSATSTGTDFLTYDATSGLRALTSAEEITSFASGNATQDNAKISTAITGINSATLLNSLVLTASGSIEGTGVLTIASGGILATGSSDIGGVTAGTLAFGSNEAIITTTTTGSITRIGSMITGTGGLSKNGAGTLTLSGSVSTYTGVTTVNGGLLSVAKLANGGVASSIGSSSNAASNLVLDGGTLEYTGAAASSDRLFSVGLGGGAIRGDGAGGLTLTNTGTIAMIGSGARILTLGGNQAVTNTLAAVISDNGGPTTVLKTNPGSGGSSTWVLSGINTYTGATYVYGDSNNTAGVLSVGLLANGGVASGIGASTSDASNLVLNRGNLQYTGSGASTDHLFSIGTAGGGLDSSGTGAVSFTNTGTIVMLSPGARTLTLTGTNTANNTLAAVIDDAGASSAADATGLTKALAGTWVLTAVNTFTGNTSITGGTLVIGGVGQFGGGAYAGNIAFTSGAKLNYASSANQTFSGLISGSGTVTQTGSGSVTLSNANTYTGGTTISAGTLVVNNTSGSATGTGALNVTSTGALSGAGTISSTNNTINGAVTVGNGGTNTTDVLTMTASGTTTFSGANLTFNLDTASTSSNTLALGSTPNVLFGSGVTTLTLNLTGGTTVASGADYILFTASSGTDYKDLTFNGSKIANFNVTLVGTTSDGTQDSLYYANSFLFLNGGNIEIEVVPEPGTWVLMLGGLGWLLAYQRVRRSKNV